MKVALLADLFELIGPESESDLGILTYELATGFNEWSQVSQSFSVDLVAKRGSSCGLPLFSIDLDELPSSKPDELNCFARQEAAYCQFILSGLLNEYDLIHSLAPIVAPLQLLSKMGIPVLQTVVAYKEHPSVEFPPLLLNKDKLYRTSVTAKLSTVLGLRHIPAPVDLERFDIARRNNSDYILWMADQEESNKDVAHKISRKLNLPLHTEIGSKTIRELQNAAFLLDLSASHSPIGNQWALRALACGKPVVKWAGSELDELLAPPGIGVTAPLNDVSLLIKRAGELPRTKEAAILRRQLILALHNKRSVIKQYLECYEQLLGIK